MNNTYSQPRYQLCYDHDCPLCVWYTGYFQQHGYLKNGEAVPFHACDAKSLGMLNQEKMTNEIPLINYQTQEVLYGPDAMLHIISGKYPAVARLANKAFARLFIDALYKLISYNRKVIVGKMPSTSGKECNPIFKSNYRYIFIIIMIIITSIISTTAVFISNSQPSFMTFITGYTVALAGSFLYMNKSQKYTLKNRLEIAGQITMLIFFASVGFLLSSFALQLTSSSVTAGICILLWHILWMQPQFFNRLQFVFFRLKAVA